MVNRKPGPRAHERPRDVCAELDCDAERDDEVDEADEEDGDDEEADPPACLAIEDRNAAEETASAREGPPRDEVPPPNAMAESPLSLSDCELPWEEDVGLSEAPSLRAAPEQWRYRGIEDDAVKTEEEDEAIVDLPDDDDDAARALYRWWWLEDKEDSDAFSVRRVGSRARVRVMPTPTR